MFYVNWAALVFACIVQAGIFGIPIAFLNTAAESPNVESLDFTLYKNTRFRECANTVPDKVDCSAIDKLSFHVSNTTVGLLSELKIDGDYGSGKKKSETEVDWCSLASCLKDYKVIPSTPLPNAFRATGLSQWTSINMLGVMGFWTFWTMKFKGHDLETCKGFGVRDWGLILWDIGSFCVWVFEFARFLSDTTSLCAVVFVDLDRHLDLHLLPSIPSLFLHVKPSLEDDFESCLCCCDRCTMASYYRHSRIQL